MGNKACEDIFIPKITRSHFILLESKNHLNSIINKMQAVLDNIYS